MTFKKNTAVTGFAVGLVSATDGSDITTGTPVGYYTLDGGTQTAIADTTPTHEGNGQWTFDLTAGEMNGDIVGLTFTHASAITAHFTIKTDTKIVSDLQDLTAAQVNAECDTALTDYDAPTKAELDARTLLAADYFDPSTDQVIVSTNNDKSGYTISGTKTTLDALNDIADTDIVSAGAITTLAGAVVNVDTVDTNNDKTGYSLTQTFPANFSDLAITATTGETTVGTNNDKSGYTISGTLQTLDSLDTAQDTQHSTTQSHLTDIKGGTFSGATDSLEAIRDRGDAAWTTGAGGTPPQLLQSTTIATLASQTSFTLTAGSADNDAYNGAVIVITDATTAEQKAVGKISDYVGATKTVTLASDPAIFTMAAGDTVDIIANTSIAVTDILSDGVALNTTSGALDTVTDVTNAVTLPTIPTNWIGAAGIAASALDGKGDWNIGKTGYSISGTKTTLDSLNDVAATDIVSAGAITTLAGAVVNVDTVDTTTTNTDMRGTDNAALATDLATVDANVDAILIDTAEIGVAGAGLTNINLPNQTMDITGNLSGSVGSVTGSVTVGTNTDKTGYSISGTKTTLDALNDVSVTDVLTTQMTESYAADGTAPTLAQALMLIQQMLGDFSISGTTLTTKQLDGTTTAATFTLDSATAPTSVTRAT